MRRACFVLVWLCACASPPPRVAPARVVAQAGADRWSSRTWEDKYDLMCGFVLPEMAVVFQKFYDMKDPELTCEGCHGDDAKQVGYHMPNGLPALNPTRMPDLHEEIGRFMNEQVTPKLARLLDRPLGKDMAGTDGVTCFTCHPRKVRP